MARSGLQVWVGPVCDADIMIGATKGTARPVNNDIGRTGAWPDPVQTCDTEERWRKNRGMARIIPWDTDMIGATRAGPVKNDDGRTGAWPVSHIGRDTDMIGATRAGPVNNDRGRTGAWPVSHPWEVC